MNLCHLLIILIYFEILSQLLLESKSLSSLKSPTATENGLSPTGKGFASGPNVPLPFPKNMET